MHRLDGAHERVSRSKEHLLNLQPLLDEFSRNPYGDARISKNQSGQLYISSFTPDQQRPPKIIPPKVSILVGEAIYNLRAALDYLVYELAYLDSKKIIKGTQFPIEDTEQGFAGRRNTYLRGVSNAHVAIIQKLQPCYGCDWTGVLRDISNPDKHMHLVIATEQHVLIPRSESEAKAYPDWSQNPSVDMNYSLTSYIGFRERMAVKETLDKLHLKVAETINAFDSEFK